MLIIGRKNKKKYKYVVISIKRKGIMCDEKRKNTNL